MLHRKRVWSVSSIESPESLAQKLTQSIWTGCTAMEFRGYLFANDATSPDGAQEYAVLKPSEEGHDLVQIESITFSWCTEARALELIQRICSGEFDSVDCARVSRERFQTLAEHGLCYLCR